MNNKVIWFFEGDKCIFSSKHLCLQQIYFLLHRTYDTFEYMTIIFEATRISTPNTNQTWLLKIHF